MGPGSARVVWRRDGGDRVYLSRRTPQADAYRARGVCAVPPSSDERPRARLSGAIQRRGAHRLSPSDWRRPTLLGLDPLDREAVKSGWPRVGMSADALRFVWGDPAYTQGDARRSAHWHYVGSSFARETGARICGVRHARGRVSCGGQGGGLGRCGADDPGQQRWGMELGTGGTPQCGCLHTPGPKE